MYRHREIMKYLLFLLIICLGSCSVMQDPFTHEQRLERARLEFEISKLYNEYNYISDSLMVEYYKIGGIKP